MNRHDPEGERGSHLVRQAWGRRRRSGAQFPCSSVCHAGISWPGAKDNRRKGAVALLSRPVRSKQTLAASWPHTVCRPVGHVGAVLKRLDKGRAHQQRDEREVSGLHQAHSAGVQNPDAAQSPGGGDCERESREDPGLAHVR